MQQKNKIVSVVTYGALVLIFMTSVLFTIFRTQEVPMLGIEAPTGMVLVDGGTFKMGDAKSHIYREIPVHNVTLSSFYMSDHEVTQAEWEAVMGSNPSEHKNCDNCPVENVSWDEVREYIDKLNRRINKKYRLPTDAEWEYAARGGKKNYGYAYSGGDTIEAVGWNGENSGDTSHPVKQKKANSLGLYDMTGNVEEWCQDCFTFYSSEPQTNPHGQDHRGRRVSRGGNFYTSSEFSRVACRKDHPQDMSLNTKGFRLASSL